MITKILCALRSVLRCFQNMGAKGPGPGATEIKMEAQCFYVLLLS